MPTEGECVCNKSYIHLVRVVEVAKRREGLKKQHGVMFLRSEGAKVRESRASNAGDNSRHATRVGEVD